MATVKKRAAKKAPTKSAKRTPRTKRSTKKSTKEALVCAEGPMCFWTTDGKVLSSLVDLRDAFGRMDEGVYRYHANKDRNDFADWVEKVLKDDSLATSLRKTRKPSTAKTLVVRRLKIYAL